MNQLTLQNTLSINEASGKLSQLAKQSAQNYYLLTQSGQPRLVLLSFDVWKKMTQDIQRFCYQTFIDEETLPKIKSFSQDEINQWLKEDKLTSKQKKLIKNL